MLCPHVLVFIWSYFKITSCVGTLILEQASVRSSLQSHGFSSIWQWVVGSECVASQLSSMGCGRGGLSLHWVAGRNGGGRQVLPSALLRPKLGHSGPLPENIVDLCFRRKPFSQLVIFKQIKLN